MESSWIDLNRDEEMKLDEKNKPRLLTESEIEKIISKFPSVRCNDKDAKDVANETLKESYRDLLRYVYLDPTMIDEYGDIIASKFIKARIVPGTSMLTTSDALAETVTQTTLSGFHASGSATSALTGIEGLKTLIFAFKPKDKVTVMHLKKPPKTFDDALDQRKNIEGVSISDLIDMKRMDIDNFTKLGRPSWYNVYEVIHGKIDFMDLGDDPDTGELIEYDEVVMRLPLRLNKIIYYDISISSICGLIEKLPYEGCNVSCVKAIYSPVRAATIDLHLMKGSVTSKVKELDRFAKIAFFRNAVMSVLDIVHIKGIPTVKKIYPVSLPVWDKSITLARHPSDVELKMIGDIFGTVNENNLWMAKLDNSSRERSGIKFDEIYNLLESLGLSYSYVEGDTYIAIYNPYSKDDLSTFIRERKNGLPYIKGSDIVSVKVNRDISYANIRFLIHNGEFYISYDPKYIKKVFYHLRKLGFKWFLGNSIRIWRKMMLDESNGTINEVLTTYPLEDDKLGVSIPSKAYLLDDYPKWMTEDLILNNPIDIAIHLESYEVVDRDRLFFIIKDGKYYIHIPEKYKDEIFFHLSKGKYIVSDEKTRFRYTLLDTPNIQVLEGQHPNVEYLKVESRYMEHIKNRLDVSYGHKSNLRFLIHSEHKTVYTLDPGGNIDLYAIEIKDDDIDKIDTQIRDSKNKRFISHHLGHEGSKLSIEEIEELETIMVGALTASFKAKTSASNYEHWYLTSKDRLDKKYTFYDTLANEYIDSERTFVNNLNEISTVLGVEAAYTYFIKALKDLNDSSGNYIDPRHILLIADFIFSRGKPYGVLFSGLSRQPLGHITLITVERAMEVLRKLAFASNKENTNSVSAALATGQINPTGTGMYMMSDDPNTQRKINEYNSNINGIQISGDQMLKAIESLGRENLNPFEVPVQEPQKIFQNRINYLNFSFSEFLKDVVEKHSIDNWLLDTEPKAKELKDPKFDIPLMNKSDMAEKLLSEDVQINPKDVKVRKERLVTGRLGGAKPIGVKPIVTAPKPNVAKPTQKVTFNIPMGGRKGRALQEAKAEKKEEKVKGEEKKVDQINVSDFISNMSNWSKKK